MPGWKTLPTEKLEIPIPNKDQKQLANGQKVIMGIRTEDLFIAHEDEEPEAGSTFRVKGVVEIVEPSATKPICT